MKDSPPRAPIPPPTAPEAPEGPRDEAVVERTGSSGPEIEVSALPGGDAEKAAARDAAASEEAAAKEATAGEEVLAPVVVTSPAETRRP